MSSEERRARVRALAKINLDLRVLGRRADGYHELRTVFQTISLADALELCYRPGRRCRIEVESEPVIADNLVERAAVLLARRGGLRGEVRIRLEKRIPIAAGLGGGSSDAAAVLLALPVLAGLRLELAQLIEMAAELGSDVPFFLCGGRALGLGRGQEVYPLPDGPAAWALIVVPAEGISTAAAYAELAPALTRVSPGRSIIEFQSWLWSQTLGPAQISETPSNDFEAVVFRRRPALLRLKRQLLAAGAQSALLSGSGSALAGIFPTRRRAEQAGRGIGARVEVAALVSRARYQGWWRRWLRPHLSAGRRWPPQSRYSR
ncbi:MAG: 4-(cytidine 5'-diphospho)-2-C-methyl-D-erythritol kinase [Bryobacterales bacterium]|nr:4-(cytidine 5'-diphospho)-2-C-methyl-D-erythritol kinase [Bryobacteraceae bacterium]MDW8129557.1 4-(cytidine 5'-diphospho)-2-C-methyl-D-erythritol kinase [Bryobacterales bacterium]